MTCRNGTKLSLLRAGVLLLLGLCATGLWILRYQESQPPRSIEALMHREGIAGAVIALRDAQGNLRVRHLGESVAHPAMPLASTTRFPIASLSKPITAAVIRRFIEQQRFGLDDPVFDLLPSMMPVGDERFQNITVRHLLQHTSGLSQTPNDPMFLQGHPAGCRHALDVTLRRSLESAPGEKMRYSNAGYCLLGELIAHKGGSDYASVVHESLGLPSDTPLTLGPPGQSIPHEGKHLSDEEWRAMGAAGGWFSDVGTLVALFAVDIRDPSIPASPVAPYQHGYYGLGWRVWPQDGRGYQLTHFGSLPGMFSVAVAYPDGRLAVALFNGRPSDSEGSAMQMYRLLDQKLPE